MGKKVWNIFRGEIISSVFYILFGLCLILIPGQTLDVICKIIFGLVLIGAGIYHIVIYTMEKAKATILDLFTGVIVLVLGAFLFVTPQIVIKLLPYLLGAFLIVDSIWTVKGSLKLRRLGRAQWKVLAAGSLIFFVPGLVLIFYPFDKISTTVLFAGCAMAANGAADIIFLILLKLGVRKAAKEAESAEQTEEKSEENSLTEAESDVKEEKKEDELNEWQD